MSKIGNLVKHAESDVVNLFQHAPALITEGKALLNEFEALVTEVKTNPDTSALEGAFNAFVAAVKKDAATPS